MRRLMLIPAVAVLMLLAAVPATTQTDLADVTPDAADPAGGQLTVSTTITGQLVDSACYRARGLNGTTPDHQRCAIACAQKGQRLAVLTAKGELYMVRGSVTANNSAKLISLLGQTVVVTGTVSQVILNPLPIATNKLGDGRRPSGDDGVVATVDRTGDFREGDVPNGGTENVIDVLTLVKK